jgi:hypothetical protein
MAQQPKQHSESGEKESTPKALARKNLNQNATEVRGDNQTAVNWLIDQLEVWAAGKIHFPHHLWEAAEELEKKQIETAYERGMNFPWVMGFTDIQPDEEAKIYFKNIYGT